MVESLGARSWVRIILGSKYLVIYPIIRLFTGTLVNVSLRYLR